MTAAEIVAWLTERQSEWRRVDASELLTKQLELAQVVARQQTVIDVLTSEVMGVRLPQHPPADVALLERRWMAAVEERDAAVGKLEVLRHNHEQVVEALEAVTAERDKLADDNDRLRRQISDREDDPELTSHLSDTCSASCRFCLQDDGATQ